MPIRSRAWIFVINNYTPVDMLGLEYLAEVAFGPKRIFMIYGYECGEEGTHHIQGYVYFKDARTRKAISKDIPRAHLEPAVGTPDDNIRYIVGPYHDKKTGKTKPVNPDVVMFGKRPSQGKASFEKVEEAMKDPKNHIHVFTQYRKAYREIQAMDAISDKQRDISICRSRDKYSVADKHKRVCFYDGTNYNGESIVFIVMSCQLDLTPKWATLEEKFFTMIDQWRHSYPPLIKNGYEMIRFDPDHIYVICDDEELYKRRFRI